MRGGRAGGQRVRGSTGARCGLAYRFYFCVQILVTMARTFARRLQDRRSPKPPGCLYLVMRQMDAPLPSA
jgi:hypothetical protein